MTQTEQFAFRNTYVYTYMHVMTINEKQEDIDLKKSKEEYWEGLEAGRGREKCNYIVITK